MRLRARFERRNMKIKTYEQLKEYLDRQEREGAVCFHGLDEKTLSKVVVGLDSHQVLTSIPNEEVKTQKFVVRQKTRNYSTSTLNSSM